MSEFGSGSGVVMVAEGWVGSRASRALADRFMHSCALPDRKIYFLFLKNLAEFDCSFVSS